MRSSRPTLLVASQSSRLSERHIIHVSRRPSTMRRRLAVCFRAGHSPSAISWGGSIPKCFSSTSTPFPLDAPAGKTSSMSGRALLMTTRVRGSTVKGRDRQCFTVRLFGHLSPVAAQNNCSSPYIVQRCFCPEKRSLECY